MPFPIASLLTNDRTKYKAINAEKRVLAQTCDFVAMQVRHRGVLCGSQQPTETQAGTYCCVECGAIVSGLYKEYSKGNISLARCV
jgi:hypothetical protein